MDGASDIMRFGVLAEALKPNTLKNISTMLKVMLEVFKIQGPFWLKYPSCKGV